MWTKVDKDRVTSLTLLTIAIVFYQFLRFVTTTCDVIGCTCQQLDNGSHVICRHLESLSSSIFPGDVFRLEIENDTTHPNGALTNDTLQPLQNLQWLTITRCGVTKITRLAFVRLGALQVLRLSHNFISDLALGSFEGLNHVRKISLDENRLLHLPEGLFGELDLDFLDLSDNLFAQIPGDSFVGSSVRSLNLNLNFLAFVEESSFHSLGTSLREMTLSYNRCPLRLHEASIRWLNLSRLHMTHSQINDTSFLINSTLLEVDISGNVPSSKVFCTSLQLLETEILYAKNLSLDSLPDNSLASLTSLRVLDLSENRLSVVRPEVFRATTQLRCLNLAYNSIGRLSRDFSRYLQNLESLNLSGNGLRHLYDESLMGMTRLKTLDLSGNRLQFISESTFRLASVVTRLDGNPLHCNCQLLWYRSWLLKRDNVTSTAAAVVTCASPFAGPLVSARVDQLHCSPPSIDHLPKEMNVTEGDDLLLSCSAMSDPLASISWTTTDRDSILMSVTPSVTQDRSVARMSAVLRLRRMGLGHAGAYVCRATTDLGSAEATLTVNVLRRIEASLEQQLSLLTTSENLRNSTSFDTLPTFSTQTTLRHRSSIEEEFHSVDTVDDDDSTVHLFETTEFISTDRQNHKVSVDNTETKLSSKRPSMSPGEPFTTQLKFSGNTAIETHSRGSSDGFTDFRNPDRLPSFTSATNAQTNLSGSSDNFPRFTTEGETWESRTENDLRNDSSVKKDEAKLFPVSYRGVDITTGLPVVGIILAFVGFVVLSGIGIFLWRKKRRRSMQYKVRPLPRRPADDVELRCYGNEVAQSIDSNKSTNANVSSDL